MPTAQRGAAAARACAPELALSLPLNPFSLKRLGDSRNPCIVAV
jgi:hypothetical protein